MDLIKKFFNRAEEGVDNLRRSEGVKKWLEELADAEKRERDWRKKGLEVVQIFEQEGSDDPKNLSDYNILYANTETLSPAVYNATPRPVVKRKVDRENPVAIASAQALKAVLVFLTDANDRDKATFDELQKSAVQEALVPGRGLARFAYEADVQGPQGFEQVMDEYICGDQVPWNRVVYGYAKNWHNIPWMAYEHFMTRDECLKNFGEKTGKLIKLTHTSDANDEDEKRGKVPAASEGVKFAHIWEIWDKRTRKVLFISEGYPELIKEIEDPLKLDGFFDCPRPIQFLHRISSLVPQTLYQMYESQAEELESATRRIKHLLAMMKVRGFYDGTVQGLDELLKSAEGTLIPAQNVAALQQGQSLEKSIWFMPLEQLIVVLQQLYAGRLQIINTIHQLTGIADIMRGATQASETLGAQEMKQAWGTMRLKRMQKEVQRFIRDCYRIQAELAAKHFGIDTLASISGMQLPRMAEKQQAQMELQAMQAEVAALPQTPELQAAVQERMGPLQQTLSTPSWEEVVQFLRNDKIRNYVIDIETNSTIDIEATEDKQELAEMMNSMSQLLNGVFPMVKEGVLPFKAAKSLMLSVVGKFRLGDEVEETFRAMQEPQAKPDPAQMKVEAEMKRDEAKFAQEQKASEAELAQKERIAQMELALQEKELMFKERELQMKMEYEAAKHARDMEMLAAKAVLPPAAPAPQPGDGGSDAPA